MDNETKLKVEESIVEMLKTVYDGDSSQRIRFGTDI